MDFLGTATYLVEIQEFLRRQFTRMLGDEYSEQLRDVGYQIATIFTATQFRLGTPTDDGFARQAD
ncbi:hypothetical protein DIJ64_14035 [Mycobacterium leprae]|uniref:Uncharacterized protein n=1 Tax=Mycobacterium leprae TaxID=1769 RepID=A0AAD0P8W9_MYCLR|nr:hypothetical protein DIJ64_14035 [Mycobacterium leprae]OAR20456.1 hypothetical protein A8144_02190 [Mycobacterium leprae 3125609]OAX72082.1 hypothetical protein A3216_02600 [Mycobacterium leprae 7935681]